MGRKVAQPQLPGSTGHEARLCRLAIKQQQQQTHQHSFDSNSMDERIASHGDAFSAEASTRPDVESAESSEREGLSETSQGTWHGEHQGEKVVTQEMSSEREDERQGDDEPSGRVPGVPTAADPDRTFLSANPDGPQPKQPSRAWTEPLVSSTAIRDETSICIRVFHSLAAHLEQADAAFRELLSPVGLEDEFGRFKVWAGNLGAQQKGHSSLDYRLRDSPLLQSNIVKLLRELQGNLIEVVSGARLSYEQQAASADFSDDDSSVASSVASSEDGNSDDESQPTTELQQRMLEFIDIINNLYRLSIKIRTPTLHTRSLKAARFRPIDPETGVDLFSQYAVYDRKHIQEVIAHLRRGQLGQHSECAEYLLERLSTSITRRRQQFRYWRTHRDKLANASRTGQTDPLTQLTVPEPTPRPEASRSVETEVDDANVNLIPRAPASEANPKTLLSGTEATAHHRTLDEAVDSQSVTSVATTARDLSGQGIELPPPPRSADGERDFECPYCFVICPARYGRERAWRTHLLQDLQPYVCTYEDCTNPNQLFRSRREWLEHESSAHRKLWRCPYHAEAVFASPTGIKNHLLNAHTNDLPEQQVDSVVNFSETSAIDARQCCPICSVDVTAIGKNIQNHIANHLEKFAAFALPKYDQTDEDKSVGSNDASIGRDSFSEGSSNSQMAPSFQSRISSADESTAWPLNQVLSWLTENSFSKGWQAAFEALGISGSKFLDIGKRPENFLDGPMLHAELFPEIAVQCGEKGLHWDFKVELEEAKRLCELVSTLLEASEDPIFTPRSGPGLGWPLERVIRFLIANNFSEEWQDAFRTLRIQGTDFLDLRFGLRHEKGSPSMMNAILLHLSASSAEKDDTWDQERVRSETRRLVQLVKEAAAAIPNASYCCHCGHGPWAKDLHASCIQCGHNFCANCAPSFLPDKSTEEPDLTECLVDSGKDEKPVTDTADAAHKIYSSIANTLEVGAWLTRALHGFRDILTIDGRRIIDDAARTVEITCNAIKELRQRIDAASFKTRQGLFATEVMVSSCLIVFKEIQNATIEPITAESIVSNWGTELQKLCRQLEILHVKLEKTAIPSQVVSGSIDSSNKHEKATAPASGQRAFKLSGKALDSTLSVSEKEALEQPPVRNDQSVDTSIPENDVGYHANTIQITRLTFETTDDEVEALFYNQPGLKKFYFVRAKGLLGYADFFTKADTNRFLKYLDKSKLPGIQLTPIESTSLREHKDQTAEITDEAIAGYSDNPFIQKLAAILRPSKGNAKVIRWSRDGNVIVILDKDRLVKEILPGVFGLYDYGSFATQLKEHGFLQTLLKEDESLQTEPSIENPVCWFHKYFRQGRPELCRLIFGPNTKAESKAFAGSLAAGPQASMDFDKTLSDIPDISQLYSSGNLVEPSSKHFPTFVPAFAPNEAYNKRVSLIQHDITKLKVDAIVNPTNSDLSIGTSDSISSHIHEAAGPQLVQECANVGPCDVGEVEITDGYKLPCRKVLHAVRPYYYQVRGDGTDYNDLLALCYWNALELAVQNNLKSIAFPCMSAGGYSFPPYEAGRIAVRTVREFLNTGEGNSLERIIFCVYSDINALVYQSLLPKFFPASTTKSDQDESGVFEHEKYGEENTSPSPRPDEHQQPSASMYQSKQFDASKPAPPSRRPTDTPRLWACCKCYARPINVANCLVCYHKHCAACTDETGGRRRPGLWLVPLSAGGPELELGDHENEDGYATPSAVRRTDVMTDTLAYFGVPWRVDENDPIRLIIKCPLRADQLAVIFKHSSRHRTIIAEGKAVHERVLAAGVRAIVPLGSAPESDDDGDDEGRRGRAAQAIRIPDPAIRPTHCTFMLRQRITPRPGDVSITVSTAVTRSWILLVPPPPSATGTSAETTAALEGAVFLNGRHIKPDARWGASVELQGGDILGLGESARHLYRVECDGGSGEGKEEQEQDASVDEALWAVEAEARSSRWSAEGLWAKKANAGGEEGEDGGGRVRRESGRGEELEGLFGAMRLE